MNKIRLWWRILLFICWTMDVIVMERNVDAKTCMTIIVKKARHPIVRYHIRNTHCIEFSIVHVHGMNFVLFFVWTLFSHSIHLENILNAQRTTITIWCQEKSHYSLVTTAIQKTIHIVRKSHLPFFMLLFVFYVSLSFEKFLLFC